MYLFSTVKLNDVIGFHSRRPLGLILFILSANELEPKWLEMANFLSFFFLSLVCKANACGDLREFNRRLRLSINITCPC